MVVNTLVISLVTKKESYKKSTGGEIEFRY